MFARADGAESLPRLGGMARPLPDDALEERGDERDRLRPQLAPRDRAVLGDHVSVDVAHPLDRARLVPERAAVDPEAAVRKG